jgi:hypothetical protein
VILNDKPFEEVRKTLEDTTTEEKLGLTAFVLALLDDPLTALVGGIAGILGFKYYKRKQKEKDVTNSKTI